MKVLCTVKNFMEIMKALLESLSTTLNNLVKDSSHLTYVVIQLNFLIILLGKRYIINEWNSKYYRYYKPEALGG